MFRACVSRARLRIQIGYEISNLRSDGRSGVVLSSLKPAAMNRGRLSTKLGSFFVPLSFSRSSDPRSGDGLAHASHHRAVWTLGWR